MKRALNAKMSPTGQVGGEELKRVLYDEEGAIRRGGHCTLRRAPIGQEGTV